MNAQSPVDFGEATERIRTWKRPVLLSHTKPDGDALGSLLAASMLLRGAGADPRLVVFDGVPDRYQFLHRYGPLPILGKDILLADLDGADGIVLLDTCSASQLEPVVEWLNAATVPKIVVDHHITRDVEVDVALIDETASATCLILYDWALSAGWTIDRPTADVLFVGISTDTGWFRHSNTDARTLHVTGELVNAGSRPHELFGHLEQQESVGRFRLRAAAMQRLELLAGDRLAVMTIPASLFAECGAALADTEDLVNEPLRIGSVAVSVMLIEQSGGIIRAGFRSRAPVDTGTPDIDVAAIASTFGGGGHRRAAGARLSGDLDSARTAIVEQLTRTLSS